MAYTSEMDNALSSVSHAGTRDALLLTRKKNSSIMSEEIDVDLHSNLALPEPFTQDPKKLRQVENLLKDLILTRKTVEKIKKTFENELENGLREEPSSLQMENTYIPELPDGTEEGKFLALDLGGTNFRVLLVEFQNGEITEPVIEHYEISKELRLGSGTTLFDYIADCVSDFLKQKDLLDPRVPLGFTFSFPVTQHSLHSGVLLNWTKTFNCKDVIGKDVVQLLNKSLIKKGCYNVSVDAILNDTTGTLMMGALLDKNTAIGLIIGTGSNACYIEKAEKVKHWETVRHGEKEVIIDIEWGAFGDNGVLDFIKTEFDVQVDENSLLVNSFTFEKYISGKYIGELVRVVLVKLSKEELLFGGELSDILMTPHSFLSEFISKIEKERLEKMSNTTSEIIQKLGITSHSEDDVKLLQHVCSIVTKRSALLVSICLSILIERIDRKEVTIAVTGSVFEKHPSYKYTMENYMALLTKKKFKLLRVTDGSGKGAAVVVAIAKKLEERLKDS